MKYYLVLLFLVLIFIFRWKKLKNRIHSQIAIICYQFRKVIFNHKKST